MQFLVTTKMEKIPTEKGMRAIGALPDDIYLEKHNLRNKVRAILVSHAHLDHVGAIPYNAYRNNAEILGSPFTMEFLKTMLQDSNQTIPNKIIPINMNGSYNIRGKSNTYKVEFISMTHSTIQSAIIAVHTPEGIILYANDYKLDNSPVYGDKPNYKRLKELSRIGIKALIVDCLYAPDDRKTPSEKIAKSLLEDVLFTTDNRKSGIIITTFSSHIARLKTITEFGARLNREVVFVGRSLSKYTQAAKNIGKADFMRSVKIVTFKKHLEKVLSQVNKNKQDYLIVCTGHQGEPGSVLDRISRGKIPLKIEKNDHIIFSSKTIPTPINELNKEQMEKRLKKYQVRIFDNVHVSILPNTEVIFNDDKGMKIKEIGKIEKGEEEKMKVPAFDTEDLKIKWYDAKLVKHPYNGKIFNITTKSGRSASITSGHSLFKLEKGMVVSEKGDNLKVGDYLAIPKKFAWHKKIEEIEVKDYITLKDKHYSVAEDTLSYNNQPITKLRIKLDKPFAR